MASILQMLHWKKRRVRHNVRSARVNSAYTPHNRLSRYKTALNTFIPYRTTNTGNTDLPVDEVGCLSNSSFSWVKTFLVSTSQQRDYQCLPTSNRYAAAPGLASAGNDPFLLPKRPYSDSCEVNCRRLLGIYKYEETLRGRKRVSMLKVVFRFARTRLLIAAFIHCLSIGLMFLGMLLFGNLIIESMHSDVSDACLSCPAIANCSNTPEPLLGIRFDMNRKLCNSTDLLDPSGHLVNRIVLGVGVFLCFLFGTLFESIRNWINLRTAIRLRTAILSSTYKRAMRSSIVNRVSPHQAMTMSNEENEAIFQLVESLVRLFGILVGFIMAFLAGLVLLPASGMLPLLGVLPIFVVLLIAGSVSKAYFRKFLSFGAKKLSLVEELCNNFKNIKTLQLDVLYMGKFLEALNRQYSALLWSNVYSSKYSGGVTSAILVGGLYLIWCDTNIKTESTEVLTLLLIFAFNVQSYMLEYCDCIHNIFHAKVTLQKLKQVYQLSTPDNIRLKPNREQLAIQMNEVEVIWPKQTDSGITDFRLYLESFEIATGQIIGITGNSGGGKTTLLHTILRNTEIRRGKVFHRGKIAFFPTDPILINDTLKQNVLFGEPLDTQRYYGAINALMLNDDILKAATTDDMPLPYLELTLQQMERVALARAVYCQRQIILLDEPLNRMPDRRLAQDLFSQMMNTFRHEKKTVIVVSQFDEFLKYCDRVFRIEHGTILRESYDAEILTSLSPEETKRWRRDIVCRGEFESCEGSDRAALNVAKSGNPQSNNRNSTRLSNGSLDNVCASRPSVNIQGFTLLDYTILIVLHLANNFLYFGPVFTLIVIVEQGDIHPWLSSICLAVIAGTFFVDYFAKTYVARIIAKRNKSYQAKLVEYLMNCSLSYLQTTKISDLVDLFADTISSRLLQIDACIHQSLMVVFALVLLLIANFWASCLVALLLALILALVFWLRYSMRHYSSFEHQSRRRMFSIMTNHLVGRAAIQSFEYVENFVQE
ncbi:ATP-binding cassette sub-family C member 12-like [Uranotaenia lowii]|uniref:ATP-binding cassette sub-family C member 12-like n=1 Tax=Uranotaenia lowii TaxID=190385 RepID=UPI0024792481|nr:ATP-binding cassette sub-family C member 12-like [Uranotaenia lowii]